ncbi:MAG: hypothetical protein FWG11_07000 [Promicromonosporaceae bacterium]|nr:hypothetical protein [Promicromonosporaceae bacterium]
MPANMGSSGHQWEVRDFLDRQKRTERWLRNLDERIAHGAGGGSGGEAVFGSMRRTTQQSITAATNTAVAFEVVDTLTGGVTVENSQAFVIPVDGWYDLRGGAQTGTYTGTRFYLTFGIGAGAAGTYTASNGTIQDQTWGSAAGSRGASISMLRYLNAGDRVTLIAYASAAASVGNFTHFTIRKIDGPENTGNGGPEPDQHILYAGVDSFTSPTSAAWSIVPVVLQREQASAPPQLMFTNYGALILSSGWYRFYGQAGWAANATGPRRLLRIVWADTVSAPASGATILAMEEAAASSGGQPYVNMSGLAYLQAGWHIRLEQYQNSGAALAGGTARFAIERAGAIGQIIYGGGGDTPEDTRWITLGDEGAPTYTTGHTHANESADYKTRFRRVGTQATLVLAVTKAQTTSAVITTLPEEFRPSVPVFFAIYSAGNPVWSGCQINPNGQVVWPTPGLTNAAYYGSISYPTG